MRFKPSLAAIVVATFIISVIPVASDGSDAADMTVGSSGAGFEIKDLSGADLDKFILPGYQEDYAVSILTDFIADSAIKYTFTEVVITDYCEKVYKGEKIDGENYTTIDMRELSFKITFKATRGSAPAELLFDYDGEKNKDIIKAIGPENNISQEGAVFTVSADVEVISTEQDRASYEKNSAGGLVKTGAWLKTATKIKTEADVKYDYTYGAIDKTISFSASNGRESSVIVDDKYDFNNVAVADVTDSTVYTVDRSISQYGYHKWDNVTYDGDTRGEDLFYINPDDDGMVLPSIIPGYRVYDTADIVDTDLTVSVYHLFGSDFMTSIFTPFDLQLDASLKDETALKTFISAHGSYSEGSFDDVQDAANKSYSEVSYMDELKLAFIVLAVVIGVVGLLFLILIIVVIILIVKRKKR